MPSGIPVATVAIDGAANAGILAAQMLSIGNKELREKVKTYCQGLKEGVVKKAEKLNQNIKTLRQEIEILSEKIKLQGGE